MNYIKLILPCFAFLVMFTGCKKDEDPIVSTGSLDGIFVLNEGSFGSSNGSISFVTRDGDSKHEDLFYAVNKRPLGDVVQSMTSYNGRGFIVVNNSQKIEIVNLTSFKSMGVISGFSSPRFFLPLSFSKAYVTDWFANRVAIVDLNANKITGSISVGQGPEQIVLAQGRAIVCNIGGFGSDSTVSVINPVTDLVEATIAVGINPNSMAVDKNGAVWVLCGGDVGADWTGGTADDIGGSLFKIDPITLAVTQSFQFGQMNHPLKMTIDAAGENIFFLFGQSAYGGKIRKFNIADNNLPTSDWAAKSYYGLGVDPTSGNVYGAQANDFTNKGWIFRYNIGGTLVDSSKVGIGPSGFLFN